jgi:membrane protease YdiL (CAAX protease family)
MSNKIKGVVVYLALAFGIAWILWAVLWRLGLSPRDPLFQVALLPGGFAPAVAALIVRRWVTREGFADAGLKLGLRNWRAYLVAWLSPLAVATLIVVLAAVTGIGRPDFTLQRALRALVPGADPPAIPPAVWLVVPVQFLVVSLIATPLLFGEEFGWRGYLQMRLLAGRPVLAAAVTGLIWGVWHYPLILMGYQYPADPILGLLVFPVSAVLLSIVFGWLRLRTGSVWAASLAHAATNASGASLITLLFTGGPNWLLVSYFGVLGWIPLGALCAWIVLGRRLEGEEAGTAAVPREGFS